MITKALIVGDTQVPFHDSKAWNVVCQVAKDLKPDRVIHLGDLFDCWQISDFDKDPSRKNTLQDDIDTGVELLLQLEKSAGAQADFFLLEGNHEDRLRRTIWRMSAEQRNLLDLRSFKDNMNWPSLIKEAGGVNWKFIPTSGQARVGLLPMFITKHGSVVRKWSGQSAKAEWERYGQSGISGHTHRSGLFYTDDFNGAHVWIENGCTCRLDPEYTEDPNWQQGFTILTYTSRTNFSVEPVHIHNGVAVWRGKEYKG